MADILESEVEAALVNALHQYGCECLKLEVKGRRGWPDRLCLGPGGRTAFVELKRPKGGVLSRQQELRRDWLIPMGHTYALIATEEAAVHFAEEFAAGLVRAMSPTRH